MAGEIHFATDHTFISHEWDATHRISDAGDWHVSGNTLVLNFHGGVHTPKHLEFSLTLRDRDHLILRQANSEESTFERLK